MSNRSRSEAGSRMEPTEFVYNPELNGEQWDLIADLLPTPILALKGVGRRPMHVLASKAFFGCFAVAQGGKTYRVVILHVQRFTVDSLSGLVAESLIKPGNDLFGKLIVKVNSIGKKDLLMARLPRLKKG